MPVNRYSFSVNSDNGNVQSDDDPNGEYVSFEDYQKALDIIKDLSLCVDEYNDAQGTHYIDKNNGRIYPKGSFIALVQRAKDIIGE